MPSERSLNRYLWLREWITRPRTWWLRVHGGFKLAADVDISLSAVLGPRVQGAIAIGDQTTVGPLSILSAALPDGGIAPIKIGRRCFIGANCVIAPGISIGDGVVVAAGAVVLRNVPDDCMVAGNPARVVRRGLRAGRFGRLPRPEPTEYQQKFEEIVKSLLRKTGR